MVCERPFSRSRGEGSLCDGGLAAAGTVVGSVLVESEDEEDEKDEDGSRGGAIWMLWNDDPLRASGGCVMYGIERTFIEMYDRISDGTGGGQWWAAGVIPLPRFRCRHLAKRQG